MQKQCRKTPSRAFLTMHVPEHISVTGEALKVGGFDERGMNQRDRIMEMMNVPDRIILTGGDNYQGHRTRPTDAIGGHHDYDSYNNELKDLPSTLTLVNATFPDIAEPSLPVDEALSQSSIAIDDNPIQELKLMRRQLGRVSTRLYQLEDEVEKRNSRDKYFITTLLGFAAALLFAVFRR